MIAPRLNSRETRGLRPDLAACLALRRLVPDRLDRAEAPTRGVLAELAREGRPS